ncbi:hypothetical protein CsatB_002548 [Cannabis sativa]
MVFLLQTRVGTPLSFTLKILIVRGDILRKLEIIDSIKDDTYPIGVILTEEVSKWLPTLCSSSALKIKEIVIEVKLDDLTINYKDYLKSFNTANDPLVIKEISPTQIKGLRAMIDAHDYEALLTQRHESLQTAEAITQSSTAPSTTICPLGFVTPSSEFAPPFPHQTDIDQIVYNAKPIQSISTDSIIVHFEKGFFKISTPLTELTKRNQQFLWTDNCEASFQELKQRLIIALVLALPSDREKFIVYCDASKQGLRVCVLSDVELRNEILEEAHTTPYSLHPGTTKMYQDLRPYYWWCGMKKDVVEFVFRCLTCQQIKAEHQRPVGLLQPLALPEWKCEDATMELVVGLPRTTEMYDSIWVVVDRFTKPAHFLPVKTTFTVDQYAKLYVKEIVRLHGALKFIIWDRDLKFTLKSGRVFSGLWLPN